jgi:hypothetical protein
MRMGEGLLTEDSGMASYLKIVEIDGRQYVFEQIFFEPN